MTNPPIHLRHFDPDIDLAFVRDAWIRSGERCAKIALGRWFRKGLYYEMQRDIVTSLLDRAETVVACDSQDRRVVVGFACGEPSTLTHPVLHFVYAKEAFRRFGVAPQCLAAIGVHRMTRVICTTWAEWCDSENEKRAADGRPLMRFNPYPLGVLNGTRARTPEPAPLRNDSDSASDCAGGREKRFFHSWLDREPNRGVG